MLAGSVAARAAEPPRPLRIVSFNLLHGVVSSARIGDGEHLEERLAMAIAGLRALDADVIGLQEASVATDRGDVAARVADALGYHHVRASSGWRWMGWMARTFLGFEEGPAIVSRFPITSAGSEGARFLRETLHMRDTFHVANPRAEGLTVWQPVRDPERRVSKRVDFVLASPAPDATLRVLDSRVVLDQPGTASDGAPLWPSDHYGVLSELALF